MAVTRTPQEFPGPLLEDQINFYDQYGTMPSEKGSVLYSDGYFYFKDGYETFIPQTPEKHKRLRQLIHFIDDGPAGGFLSGAYREILPLGNPFPTQVIWWTSSAKIIKIIQTTIVRNANKTPSSIEWVLYDSDGISVLETVTDNISYSSGIFESNRTRTIV